METERPKSKSWGQKFEKCEVQGFETSISVMGNIKEYDAKKKFENLVSGSKLNISESDLNLGKFKQFYFQLSILSDNVNLYSFLINVHLSSFLTLLRI